MARPRPGPSDTRAGDPDGPREHLLRSAGRPLPWVELRIVDPSTGGDLGPRGVGEVWMRAPNVMAGDFHRPEETAAEQAAWAPIRRVADPREIAQGALFLATDESSFAVGSCLVLDGGYTAK